MENNEDKIDTGNMPAPIEDDGRSGVPAATGGLPRVRESDSLPHADGFDDGLRHADEHEHADYSDDDRSMSGGYASVKDGGIPGSKLEGLAAGGKPGGEGRLLWITVAVMSVLCVIIAVCASILTAHFMRSGEKPPVINTTEEKQSVAAVVQARKPCVVELMCGSLRGSGVVTKRDGGNVYVVTNAHVLRGYIEGTAASPSVRFYGEDEFYGANVVGYDLFYDIAVLSLNHDTLYTVYDLDGNDKLFSSDISCGEGERVVSIGNALGFGIAAYDGIVSRGSELLECNVLFSDDKKFVPVMRTTAVVNAGMSGGALFDMQGRFVGLGTYRMSNTDGVDTEGGASTDVEDTGFATPVSVVYSVYKRILNNANGGEVPLMTVRLRKVNDSAIGYIGLPLGFNCEYRSGKLTVVSLDQGTPNRNVKEGDVITHIGGMEVTTDICATVGELLKYNVGAPGDALKIKATRNGAAFEFTVDEYRYAI